MGSKHVTLIQKGSHPNITIQSNNVIIENMNIKYINDSSEGSPAILITGDNNSLDKINIITDSYGIQLDNANHNIISDVKIEGNKNEPIINRQHGIDLWESHHNEIYDTCLQYVMDGIYIERSNENIVSRNTASHSRYGYHLMFTKNTVLEENESYENISGMMIMGTNGTVAKHNTLFHNQKNIQSLGLLLFDVKNATIKQNNIVNNRIGIFIESASENKIAENNIQGNYIGVQFKSATDNDISSNSFIANVSQGQAEDSSNNIVNKNYWGDHRGLDLTGDGTSNLTYSINPFFLKIAEKYPPFQLLFQSPGMVFIEQLIHIPVDEQFVDQSPLMENPLVGPGDQSGNQMTVLLFCMSLLVISIVIIYLGVKNNEKI